jgi:uncharacterized protein
MGHYNTNHVEILSNLSGYTLITTTWILANAVVLSAAFVMCVTGYGFVLVTAALLLFFLDVKTMVVLNVILGTIICLPILWQSRNFLQPRKIAVLIVSSILGLPLGIYALSHIASSILKLTVISIVILFALALALGISFKFKKENLACSISGFISGALSNSAGLGGPPIVLLLLNQGWEKDVFRGNISAYFALNGLAAAVSLGVSQHLPFESVVYAFSLVPALIVGYYLGTLLVTHINAALFRKISIYLLLGCALLGIIETMIEYF